MRKIPFTRLFDSIQPHLDEYMAKIEDLVRKTEFVGGPEIEAFESRFAEWTESVHAVGTANGTDAIIIALRALGIGIGDKVLVPVNTFIATSESVTMVGAEVDFIDVEADYFTIDPEKIIQYLESPKGRNVKALIPVHLYGQMADMPKIRKIADEYSIKIIEDSAQAHGATCCGHQPGFYGDIATYSFYPGKNIGAFGDAGAITTNDRSLHRLCKMLVNHGRLEGAKYEHEIEGFNMRLDSLQAAVLNIRLNYIDDLLRIRKAKAAYYLKQMIGIEGLSVPKVRLEATHVWHIMPIMFSNRDKIRAKLADEGIATGIHYPIPLHLQPAYQRLGYSVGDFPIAERIASQQLSLPIWPEIALSDIDWIISIIKK